MHVRASPTQFVAENSKPASAERIQIRAENTESDAGDKIVQTKNKTYRKHLFSGHNFAR